ALSIIPRFDPASKTREKTSVNIAIVAAAAANRRTKNPRCTSTYRALRRSSAGISITRCFTTAYANESGYTENTITRTVSDQNAGRNLAKSTSTRSSTIGKTPAIVPTKMPRDFRLASSGTLAEKEFRAALNMPSPNNTYSDPDTIRSAFLAPTHPATTPG